MTQDKDSQADPLDKLLQDMIAQAEMLVRVTSEEGLALREADIDVLNDKVKAKKEIVASLTELDSQFRSNLNHHGYTTPADISVFITEAFSNTTLCEHWQQYISLMRNCDKNNRENSALVNVGLRHTKQAIEFLQSCIGENHENPVYEPSQFLQKPAVGGNSSLIAKA